MISQLGPYLIDEELAEGGMARVFRARLRGLGGFEKTLVIKQIRPELAKDPRFVELFVREANTLVQLSHPHIVPVYELGAVDGTYYLSMEYVEGATVARLLQDGPLAAPLVAHLGAQVCDALEYAHGRFGILHRDITPRNIIVDHAGHARLVDFGIAGAAGVIDSEALGSPGYMSPEQARRRALAPATDLFSLGAVLFEAATGRPAFEKTARGALGPTPRFEPRDGVPAPLASILSAMLAPEVEQRPSSAAEVARQLRAYLAQARPEGVLTDMRERAERARVVAAPTPDAPATPVLEATAKIEPRVLATSPVLTEMLRSAPGAPLPSAPGNAAVALTGPAAPSTPTREGESSTRRITSDVPPPRSEVEPEPPEDETNASVTASMMRLWPWTALLTLLVAGALVMRTREPTSARPQPSAPTAPANASPPSEAPSPRPLPATPETPGTHAPEAPTPAVPSTTPVDREGGRDEARSGTLSVNATPWAEVTLDGKRLGTTPVRNLKLRAGSHVIRLRCPPLARAKELRFELAEGANARISVDLSAEPARTFLDGASEVR